MDNKPQIKNSDVLLAKMNAAGSIERNGSNIESQSIVSEIQEDLIRAFEQTLIQDVAKGRAPAEIKARLDEFEATMITDENKEQALPDSLSKNSAGLDDTKKQFDFMKDNILEQLFTRDEKEKIAMPSKNKDDDMER